MDDEKKLFQCRGYGNCRMTFTRSEHLARHERKHTGEKPFNCIVPGCSRKFSRFDNMMQHTQTHHTSDDQVPELIKSKRKRMTRKPTVRKIKKSDSMSILLDELFLLSDSSVLTSDEEEEEEEVIIGHMILPHLANYLVDHPDEPPENYFFKYYHRLTKQDLLYPIEYLLLANSNQPKETKEDIYITIDEFEAIQGLGCFYTCQK